MVTQHAGVFLCLQGGEISFWIFFSLLKWKNEHIYILNRIRLLPHHNNVRTTTVVVVVVHTPHSILKNDRTCTVIRTSKCTVPMIPNPKKLKKNFFLEKIFKNLLGVR